MENSGLGLVTDIPGTMVEEMSCLFTFRIAEGQASFLHCAGEGVALSKNSEEGFSL